MKWKRKKQKRKLSKIIVPSALLLFLIAVVLLLRLNVFTVGDFEVKGQVSCADANQIRSSVTFKGQKVFLIDSAKVEKDLKSKFFCIKSAAILKGFPDKVTVEVFGRNTVAALINLKENEASLSALIENMSTPSAQEAEGVYGVDEENIVFVKDIDSSSLPKIFMSGQSIPLGKKLDEGVKDALKIFGKIKTFGVTPGQGWIADSNFLVYLTPAPKVVFELKDKIDVQLASLQLILTKAKIDSKEVEFIDLRFDKPIVKFAPKK